MHLEEFEDLFLSTIAKQRFGQNVKLTFEKYRSLISNIWYEKATYQKHIRKQGCKITQ